MTYCDTLTEPLRRRIESGESLEEIGSALCGSTVKNPKRKAIRLIKSLLGESILKKNAQTLQYNVNKGNRIKGLSESPQQRNFVTKETDELQSNEQDNDTVESKPEPAEELDSVIEQIQPLVQQYGIEMIIVAVQFISQNNTTPTELKT